jgi:hypothetical protein
MHRARAPLMLVQCRVAVVGVGAVWRTLSPAQPLLVGAEQLHRYVESHAIASNPITSLDDLVPAPAKTVKLMSTGAKLAAIATRQALAESSDHNRTPETIGYFLGAGASGDLASEMTTVVAASLIDGRFSDIAFGQRGLRAMNPLKSFALLSNFTMCFSAIFESTRGANAVMFSRGSGTVFALLEAIAAIEDSSCTLAIAAGADTCDSELTMAELHRDGWLTKGLQPSEGGASLLLAPPQPSKIRISMVAVGSRGGNDIDDDIRAALDGCDVIITTTSVPLSIPDHVRTEHRTAMIIDLGLPLGDALAASPALGWAFAVMSMQHHKYRRVAVVSRGIDDTWCAVQFVGAGS